MIEKNSTKTDSQLRVKRAKTKQEKNEVLYKPLMEVLAAEE